MSEARPIRVLYLARAPFISGAERALMSMLRHLDRGRVEPALVLGHDTALAGQAAALGVPVSVVPLPKREPRTLPGYWGSLWRLRRVIRRFQPDVLHANDVPSCQAMSVLGGRLGVPRVVHVRWGITAGDMGWWARAGCERVLCISQWVREELGEVAGTPLRGAGLEVLPDAVDWPAETGEAEPAVAARSDAGGEESGSAAGVTLGFAGQIIEAKGLDLLIRAMALLGPARSPRLLVAGEDTQSGGAVKRALRQLAEESGIAGRVEWLGFLAEVGDLYRRVDAVACPSRVEPLGLVPLEAARWGLPAIANRVGGLAETIDPQETGWLVEPTPEAWAAALPQLADRGETARRGRNAWRRTRDRYHPALYQQRLLACYRALAIRRP